MYSCPFSTYLIAILLLSVILLFPSPQPIDKKSEGQADVFQKLREGKNIKEIGPDADELLAQCGVVLSLVQVSYYRLLVQVSYYRLLAQAFVRDGISFRRGL